MFKKSIFILTIIVFIFLIISICQAHDINLEWDHDGTNLGGFNLYQNDTNSADLDPNKIVAHITDINAREYQLLNVLPNIYYYYLTALDIYNNESEPSNILKFDPDKIGTNPPTIRFKSVKETIRETITKVIEKIITF